MTRRERLERRQERREEWAEGRSSKAAALHKRNEPFRGDHAFNTQPGHIPERARLIKRENKAFEHTNKAADHAGKADGIARQLETSIFSDDADAIEQLTAKIANLTSERDRMKKINAAWRKAGKPGPDNVEGWRMVADHPAVQMNVNDLADVRHRIRLCPYNPAPFPSYSLTNLGGTISNAKKRIAHIKHERAQTAKAEEAGGTLIELTTDGTHARITFDEYPGRNVVDALKRAGFYWSRPSWNGPADKVPEGVGC